jgi:phospholipid-binding lipoprotein MlaA
MLKIAKLTLLILIIFCFEARAGEQFELATVFDNFDRSQKEPLEIDDAFDEEFEEFTSSRKSLEIYDPLEKINRKIYAFNDVFDRYFFEHVARAYRKGVPKTGRKMITNFINNLALPMSAVNSFLQGKTDNGFATISNFLINSTIGVLGIFNIASEKGILYNQEDFGQTLGHYRVGFGPYLMLPFLGPSSSRDFSGWLVDRSVSIDGVNIFEVGGSQTLIESRYLIGLTAVSAINTRESLIEVLDNIRQDSFDPYATIRSAYLQRRINEISK